MDQAPILPIYIYTRVYLLSTVERLEPNHSRSPSLQTSLSGSRSLDPPDKLRTGKLDLCVSNDPFHFQAYPRNHPSAVAVQYTFFMLRLAPEGPLMMNDKSARKCCGPCRLTTGWTSPDGQYGDYLLNLLKGDLGPSFKYPGRTVNEIIRDSFPNSMELGFYSMSIALALGLTLGILLP